MDEKDSSLNSLNLFSPTDTRNSIGNIIMRRKASVRSAVISLLFFGLTGCISPQNFESEPVEVRTPEGLVTCQLYTKERVIWDRAIDRPETMSVEVADQVCIAEGTRLMDLI